MSGEEGKQVKQEKEGAAQQPQESATKKQKRASGEKPVGLKTNQVWRTNHLAKNFLCWDGWGLPADKQKEVEGVLLHRRIHTVGELAKALTPPELDEITMNEVADMDEDDDDLHTTLEGMWKIEGASKRQTKHRFRTMTHFLTSGGVEDPESPEDILNTKFYRLVETAELGEKSSNKSRYRAGAVSVKVPQSRVTRDEDIRIVLGSSGSGKTTFAVNALATIGKTAKKWVVFYLCCPDIVARKEVNKETLVASIRDYLQIAIKEFAGEAWTSGAVLDMYMCLVIDEAGALPDLLGKMEVLQEIYGILKAFANDCRLILAGTGYDEVCMGLSSTTDVLKYRMQPWNPDNFKAAADGVLGAGDRTNQITQAIIDDPVLEKLISNARAAFFTLEAVDVFWSLRSTSHPTNVLKGLIGAIINYALAKYITQNALGGLTPEERRKIAYAVFHEIDEASKSNEAKFPAFTKLLSDPSLMRQALGVVDVNVETRGGNNVLLVKDKPSVLVSPALSMLLFKLLGVEATVYDSWDGLESATALHAAYQEVLANPWTETLGVRMARLTRPVPEPNATKTVKIPKPGNIPTVYINGEMAPFFDVIKEHAAYQSKSHLGESPVTVFLDKELQKGGVLEEIVDTNPSDKDEDDGEKQRKRDEKAFRMGTATMAGFLHVWNDKSASNASSNGIEPQVNPKDNNLTCQVSSEGPNIDGTPIKADFLSEYLVHFVTNASEIELSAKCLGNDTVLIKSNWVDAVGFFQSEESLSGTPVPGQATENMEEDADERKTELEKFNKLVKTLKLRQNIKLCFVFTGN